MRLGSWPAVVLQGAALWLLAVNDDTVVVDIVLKPVIILNRAYLHGSLYAHIYGDPVPYDDDALPECLIVTNI